MLNEGAVHPALESQVFRFFFRSDFFSSIVEINNLRFFFREKKTDFYCMFLKMVSNFTVLEGIFDVFERKIMFMI